MFQRIVSSAALIAASAVFAAGAASAASCPGNKPESIVVNASGGSMAASMRKAFSDDFEKLFGIKVVDTSPTNFGKLKAMVQSKNVEWTLTEIGGQDILAAVEQGLLEKVDPKIVDRSGFPDNDKNLEYWFAKSAYSTVLAYSTKAFPKTHPMTWAEFWDTKKFPGPRSLRNHPVDNLEYALLADGVSPDKLYPIDVDRAFKKLDEIAPSISVWWKTG
jgi:putative spermidine/putrescine transport system substrate-binding protein